MRILLTGSTGLLGSVLLSYLETRDHEVILLEGDIADLPVMTTSKAAYDWVIHTAAITDVAACEKDPGRCFEVNIEGTRAMRRIAEAARARFLYVSTASVFSGEAGNYDETAVPSPQNAYNIS